MTDFNDSPRLALRDIAWLCERRDPPKDWREPSDRRSECGEAVMPDDSILVIPHTVDPLIAMAMSLAVIEAWNVHLGQKITQLRRTV